MFILLATPFVTFGHGTIEQPIPRSIDQIAEIWTDTFNDLQSTTASIAVMIAAACGPLCRPPMSADTVAIRGKAADKPSTRVFLSLTRC
jgi:hypothetical protein